MKSCPEYQDFPGPPSPTPLLSKACGIGLFFNFIGFQIQCMNKLLKKNKQRKIKHPKKNILKISTLKVFSDADLQIKFHNFTILLRYEAWNSEVLQMGVFKLKELLSLVGPWVIKETKACTFRSRVGERVCLFSILTKWLALIQKKMPQRTNL